MLAEYLTLTEVGERLKIHPKTIRRWIKQQKIPAIRIGHQYRISVEALKRAGLDTTEETDAETQS